LLSLAALFGAGALTSRFTSRSWIFSATRQVALGTAAAVVTFGVGSLFNVVTG
jgi:vacuolar iron transporter family protein